MHHVSGLFLRQLGFQIPQILQVELDRESTSRLIGLTGSTTKHLSATEDSTSSGVLVEYTSGWVRGKEKTVVYLHHIKCLRYRI